MFTRNTKICLIEIQYRNIEIQRCLIVSTLSWFPGQTTVVVDREIYIVSYRIVSLPRHTRKCGQREDEESLALFPVGLGDNVTLEDPGNDAT